MMGKKTASKTGKGRPMAEANTLERVVSISIASAAISSIPHGNEGPTWEERIILLITMMVECRQDPPLKRERAVLGNIPPNPRASGNIQVEQKKKRTPARFLKTQGGMAKASSLPEPKSWQTDEESQ